VCWAVERAQGWATRLRKQAGELGCGVLLA